MKAQVHREQHPEFNVVMQCPGCELWQLDYTDAVAATYAEIRLERIEEFGGEVVETTPFVDPSPWYALVEDILQEHYDECVHLRLLVDFQLSPPARWRERS